MQLPLHGHACKGFGLRIDSPFIQQLSQCRGHNGCIEGESVPAFQSWFLRRIFGRPCNGIIL